VLQGVAVCCRVLQCVAVCCRVLQCVAVCCSVLQCVALCSVLQCVAVCCSVQCVVVCCIQQRASALSRASTVSCCVGVLHSCESEFVYMLVCLRESAGVVVFVCICVCVVCLCLRGGVSVRLAIYVRICACMCAHVTGASDNVQPQVVRSHVTLFQTISLSVLHTRGTHTHTQIYIYIYWSLWFTARVYVTNLSRASYVSRIDLIDKQCTCQCTANPTWGNIFECCFKTQSSKLERRFCHVSVKKNVWAFSFQLWKSLLKWHPKWHLLYVSMPVSMFGWTYKVYVNMYVNVLDRPMSMCMSMYVSMCMWMY